MHLHVRLINVLEHIKSLAGNMGRQYVEIISKVTVALSLTTNPFNDFDFVVTVLVTSCLIYFPSLKFHNVEARLW